MKKVFIAAAVVLATALMAMPAYAEESTPPSGDVIITYHDPAVVAGRKESRPDTLTYSKVTVVLPDDVKGRIASTLDTERTNDVIDPEDLAVLNSQEEVSGTTSFYLKDSQSVTLQIPLGAAFEVSCEDLNWFPCAYEVRRKDEKFISYTWVYPVQESLTATVDSDEIDIDIVPEIPDSSQEAPETTRAE